MNKEVLTQAGVEKEVLTQAGVDKAFDRTRRKSNHIFKYSRAYKEETVDIPRVHSEGDMTNSTFANSKDSKSQHSTPFSSPRNSLRKAGNYKFTLEEIYI